jgi:hypothetical protein
MGEACQVTGQWLYLNCGREGDALQLSPCCKQYTPYIPYLDQWTRPNPLRSLLTAVRCERSDCMSGSLFVAFFLASVSFPYALHFLSYPLYMSFLTIFSFISYSLIFMFMFFPLLLLNFLLSNRPPDFDGFTRFQSFWNAVCLYMPLAGGRTAGRMLFIFSAEEFMHSRWVSAKSEHSSSENGDPSRRLPNTKLQFSRKRLVTVLIKICLPPAFTLVSCIAYSLTLKM